VALGTPLRAMAHCWQLRLVATTVVVVVVAAAAAAAAAVAAAAAAAASAAAARGHTTLCLCECFRCHIAPSHVEFLLA